jgi:hypothetical protein
MKKNLFFAFIGVILCGCLAALPSAVRGQGRALQARFNATSWDFGKIRETDGPVSHTFEFTNTGKTPYVIEFISVSCGCTTPEYSKAPVLPGRTGSIKVTYDPADRPGVFNRSVVITANNRTEQIPLVILGEVVGRPRTPEEDFPIDVAGGLRATSNTLLFGYVPRGGIRTQVINLYNNSTEDIRPAVTVKGPEKNTVRVVIDPEVLKPGQRGYLSFQYDLEQADLWGLINTAFNISVGGQAAANDFNAYATVVEDFTDLTQADIARAAKASFSTQFYHFGDVKVNEALAHSFQIVNTGGSDLVIRNIKVGSNRISYTIDKRTIKPGESATMKVTLKPNQRSVRLSESVTLILSDPTRPMREVRLAANVI